MRPKSICSLAFLPLLISICQATWSPPKAKNFIYVVPDGYGQASQTMARDYVAIVENGQNASMPVIRQLGADTMVLGTVRTHPVDTFITDSAASATAFGCGVKTHNNVVAVDPDGMPVGSILEAAKLAGMKTGLVVTSQINDATPSCYIAHAKNRNALPKIAELEIGYGHPLGPSVDVIMGGARCHFKPQSDPSSCREDDIDLFAFAEEQGYRVMQDRAGFDELEKGNSETAKLPYIGLFNDASMQFEIDRRLVPTEEPSLLEMAETALTSLTRATRNSTRGYFIMIEASRIDHAGHASDAAAHVHDTIMYNKVLSFVREWIDAHPDTMMLSAADHECGGLTVNGGGTLTGFDPRVLAGASASLENLNRRWDKYTGSDRREFLKNEILPAYGLGDASDAEIDALLKSSSRSVDMGRLLAKKAGINWSTGQHTGADVTLHGYAAGRMGRELRADMSGNFDNTELPRYIEKVLGIKMSDATEKLRRDGVGWVGQDVVEKAKRADCWH